MASTQLKYLLFSRSTLPTSPFLVLSSATLCKYHKIIQIVSATPFFPLRFIILQLSVLTASKIRPTTLPPHCLLNNQ